MLCIYTIYISTLFFLLDIFSFLLPSSQQLSHLKLSFVIKFHSIHIFFLSHMMLPSTSPSVKKWTSADCENCSENSLNSFSVTSFSSPQSMYRARLPSRIRRAIIKLFTLCINIWEFSLLFRCRTLCCVYVEAEWGWKNSWRKITLKQNRDIRGKFYR